MVINTVKLAKQCIKKKSTISACANIGRNIGTISKILIADIKNFAISAADILPIQYIGRVIDATQYRDTKRYRSTSSFGIVGIDYAI